MNRCPCRCWVTCPLGGRLLESDEVHLDPEVLHQQLPGHAAHRVEGVVRVGVGGACVGVCKLELKTNLCEDYAKFYNHVEGLY